ncbi:hypothetical protein EZV62_003673 [Acer yangbiense]|uniref:Serine-threonine/tyrosine-protein kinase catalytic domain-containing protein n=1 Tax=Acer yangbiense TaxID=1000413 RepID=A0A5C7IHZ4_9ROSI|nr:hypothetical protein EZV62_003673 [Acer yangbiense]
MLAKGDIKNIVDPRLNGDFNINCVRKAVKIAMASVSPNLTSRPTMTQVVMELNECLAIEIARTKVNQESNESKDSIESINLNTLTELSSLAREEGNCSRPEQLLSKQVKKTEMENKELDQVCKGSQPYTGLATREIDKAHYQSKVKLQRLDRKKLCKGSQPYTGLATREIDKAHYQSKVKLQRLDRKKLCKGSQPYTGLATREIDKAHYQSKVKLQRLDRKKLCKGSQPYTGLATREIDKAHYQSKVKLQRLDRKKLCKGSQPYTGLATREIDKAHYQSKVKLQRLDRKKVSSQPYTGLATREIDKAHYQSKVKLQRLDRKKLCKGSQPYTGLATREIDKAHYQSKVKLQRLDRKKLCKGSQPYTGLATREIDKAHYQSKVKLQRLDRKKFDYQAELSSLKIGRDLSTREVKDTLGFQHKYPELGRETPDSSGVSTRYCVSNRLTEKSDVYSFGVVLLEIITSKSAIIRINEREKTHLSQWVDSFLAQGDIRQIVDSRLQGNFNVNSVWKAVEVAMACLSPTANKRPTMNVVVTELNESLATEMCRSNKSDNCSDSNNSINHMVSKNFGNTEPNPRAR